MASETELTEAEREAEIERIASGIEPSDDLITLLDAAKDAMFAAVGEGVFVNVEPIQRLVAEAWLRVKLVEHTQALRDEVAALRHSERAARQAAAELRISQRQERQRAEAAEAEVRRLREGIEALAKQWTQGQWSDVFLPKPTPPAVPVIAYADRVGDWLRDHVTALIRDGEAS